MWGYTLLPRSEKSEKWQIISHADFNLPLLPLLSLTSLHDLRQLALLVRLNYNQQATRQAQDGLYIANRYKMFLDLHHCQSPSPQAGRHQTLLQVQCFIGTASEKQQSRHAFFFIIFSVSSQSQSSCLSLSLCLGLCLCFSPTPFMSHEITAYITALITKGRL